MLTRRHVGIGGGDDPRFIYLNGKFIDIGEDGTLSYSSDAGIDLNNTVSYGAVIYGEAVANPGFFAISMNGNNATAATLLLDRAEVLDNNEQLKYDALTDVTFNLLNRLRNRFANGTYAIGVQGTRLFSFYYLTAQSRFSYVDETTLSYTASDLAADYDTTTMYICDRTNNAIKAYDNITHSATQIFSFSTSTELTDFPMLAEFNADDNVLYVLDRDGNVAAYDVSSGSGATALGTVTLSSFPTTITDPRNSGNMTYDSANSVLLVTEGEEGNAIHVIDVSNHASMTATRIAGGTAMVGGSMLKYPVSVDIKYDKLFIFSGYTDSQNDVQVISVDNSAALSTSSEVLGSLTGSDLGFNSSQDHIGYGKVY